MSISGGLSRAVERAGRVDATALQIFVKSSRQWAAKPLSEEEASRYREAVEQAGLGRHTLAHASYLINLAAPDATVRRRSAAALNDEMDRCSRLGVSFLVLHPGSHVGTGEDAGLLRIVRALDRLLARSGSSRRQPFPGVTLLLETTAGQGSNLGGRFEQLGRILRLARCPERLGVCFDTCHALAAGYDFRDASTYRAMLREFDREIGLDRLLAFHLNDSKHPLGSRKDRHEHIGRGEVGLEAFRLILNDRRFRGRPMVLETPKGEDLREDRENLAVLRAMLPGRKG
jgi:deoxyribonuclease-4